MAAQTPPPTLMARAAAVTDWFDTPAGRRTKKYASYAVSLLILLVLADAIRQVGWREVIAILPLNPIFWLLLAGSYFLQPLTEWHIYRRWWGFGWPALAVFLKMRVMNEALFSYSGHTYLLVWAAQRMGLAFDPDAPPPRLLGRGDGPGADPATSPFAVVKDMAITSGIAGNFATLLILIAALAMPGDRIATSEVDPGTMRLLLWSFGAMILLNIGIIGFRNRVMSLPAKENLFAFRWHLLRVTLGHILVVGSWIVALPLIPFETWFLLGALRMVIGRMPIPNKELLFAALAVALTGDASIEVAALMAAQGALHLIFHGLAWTAASAIEATAPDEGTPRAR
jgi:hypothetical protein